MNGGNMFGLFRRKPKEQSEEALIAKFHIPKNKVPGVYFHKEKQKYHARLRTNGTSKHVGYFDTREEAERAITKLVKVTSFERAVHDPEAWKTLSQESHASIVRNRGKK